MTKFKLLSAAAAVFAAPLAVQAQQITSQIEGVVATEAGQPLRGATVTVTDTRTGATRTLTANEDGRFTATGLTVGGPYTVTAEAGGFQGQTVQNVSTSLEGATTLSFSLTAATAADTETIVVTGQRANVQLRAIGPGTAFSTEVVQNASTFNRDIRDVIRLDPRVSLDRDDTGTGQDRVSCLGGNDRVNSSTVDGISQSDVYGLTETGFASRSGTPIPYDSVREVQVQFAPMDVEYGGFTGCSINVVTRSGSNDFHGGAFFERNNDRLHGHTVPGRATLRAFQPDQRYGGSLGGPIIPDHLFFFGAYEHQTAGQSQDDGPVGGGYANPQTGITVAQFQAISDVIRNVYGIDTGPLVTSRPFNSDRYFGRLDWQINDRHRLEATYQRLEESTLKADDLFTGNSPQAVGLNTFYVAGTISNYYSGRLYSNWTDNLSTEFRYSRSEVIDQQDPFGGGEAQSANPIPRIVVGIDNPTGIDGAVLAGPGTSRSANDLQTTIEQYRALINLQAGSHHFKLGFEYNHADLFNLFVQNATGTLVFRNISDLQQGLLSPGTGNNQTSTTPANVISGATEGAFGNFTPSGDINQAAASFSRDIWSIYAQDEWAVTDSLNVVLGVRTDWLDGTHPLYNPNFERRYGFANTASFSNIDPVVQPRVGFTYSFDRGILSRAQLRGGAGIFSGGDPGVFFGNVFQNNGVGFALGSTQAAGCPAGQIDVVVNGQFTGVPSCIRASAQATAGAGLGNVQSIDPDIKAPSVFRANLGFQTDLNFGSGFFSGWRLNLDYIYSRYENPLTLVDLAQTPDIRRGLGGFTIDGRPLYGAIDPTVAGCTARLVGTDPRPTYTGVTAACFTTTRGAELMLTNSDGYTSQIASVILSKTFNRGILTSGGSVYFNIGYAYTDSHDRRSFYNSTAGSNFNQSAADDRQNPSESRSFYESRHNIAVNATFREEFVPDLATTFGINFIARSGRPYSLTFQGNNVFASTNGGLTTADNALAYIPNGVGDPNISPTSNAAAVQQLVDFTQGLNCARSFAGHTIARNSCTSDWYLDMDLTLSQEVPGPLRWAGRGHDSIRLYATMDNFLNFLKDSWNIQRRIGNFFGVEDVATLGTGGVDAQGRYIINSFTVPGANVNNDVLLNVSSSVWRLKVGISYRF
jgi:outer membrane receptor for ferrienterochelin and colicin